MKEIGGYMQFETYYGHEYHEGALRFNTARSGIKYIQKKEKYSKYYIPHYLCDCMYEMMDELKISYEFYHVNKDMLPDIRTDVKESECVYIVNYFGQVSNKTILGLKDKYKNIIFDNTQSFFQEPIEGIDTLYSCRKYFGVSDGAYLHTDKKIEEPLERDVNYNRFKYLIGRYEKGASMFFEEFKTADYNLKYKQLKAMPKLTQNILKSLDYSKIKNIRENNFKYLAGRLSKYNKLKDLKIGTFMYPLMIDNAEEIRKELISKKVFIPTLWPNVLEIEDKESYDYKFAEKIIPIPIDQRYGEEEMKSIADEIESILMQKAHFNYLNEKEIGGYMQFETYSGKEYHEDCIPLNVSRNAIRLLCEKKNYKKVYVPYYLGWSIFDMFNDNNIKYECYHLNKDLTPNFNKKIDDDECLFVVNFFGQLSNEEIAELKSAYKNIMIDSTQAFFQKAVKGVDTFYTCHKNFGVTDGAYLSTDLKLDEELKVDTSYERFEYLTGRYELGAPKFYEMCKKCDDDLRYLEIKKMSKITQNILKSLDYEKIKKVREDNFNYLNENLKDLNELKDLKTGNFMYPLLIKNGAELKKKLVEKKIYIPMFWKNVIGTVEEASFENYMIYNLLPIPIDHRYGLAEMKFIVEEIKKLTL